METRLTFFRQSGWLVVATVASGVFMTATQIVASRWMDPGEWGLWLALLRIYLLMSIPSAGLQIIFAQQTAAAVTLPQHHQLAHTVRSTLKATFIFWLLLAVVAYAGTQHWMGLLKISRPAAWHCTLLIGLASLWSPLVRGILQGQQNFLGLGWVLILDGVGRFVMVWIILAFGGQAAGGMAGALFGTGLAIVVGGWLIRELLREPGAPIDWRPWLRRTVPLTLAIGSVQFMMIVDVPYVRSVFPVDQTETGYMPAALIGLAMITLLLPMSAVMFPKIVRSAALTQTTRALEQALIGTALLGVAAASACVLFPKLPLQIIFFGKPDFWAAAPLVPWFTWCTAAADSGQCADLESDRPGAVWHRLSGHRHRAGVWPDPAPGQTPSAGARTAGRLPRGAPDPGRIQPAATVGGRLVHFSRSGPERGAGALSFP